MNDENNRKIGALVLTTRDLLQQGADPQKMHDQFVENGMKSDDAWFLINHAARYLPTGQTATMNGLSDERKSGLVIMLIGVGLFGLGGIITAVSYNATAPGGHYLITTGLFLVGVWQFLRGLWRLIAG